LLHHNRARFLSDSGLNPTAARRFGRSPTLLRNRDLHSNLKTGPRQQQIAMKTVNVPMYSVGDIVRNFLTGEEGQIVRTLNSCEVLRRVESQQSSEPAYIVSLPPGPLARAREALWLRSEVIADRETCAEGDQQGAADDRSVICWVCGKDVLAEDQEIDGLGRPIHIVCQRSDSVPINVKSS